MASFEELNARYPEKIGKWLKKAKEVEARANDLVDYIHNFKYEMVKMADGSSADKNAIEIKRQDDTNVSGIYGLTQGNAKILQKKIEDYREFIKNIYGNNQVKNDEYDRIFSTKSVNKGIGETNVPWDKANF